MRFLKLAALGGSLWYVSNARRRALLRDRVLELARSRRGQPERSREPGAEDQTLKAKIESEVFREADAPKGDVNINVDLGVVYLRGQLEDQSLIDELEQRVRAVQGVNRVENLLHVPGPQAPQAA